ncbi:MFS transporter [Dickeya aquatica]|uniref:Fosmidomycin resistance protein n=1 Tax=Dickeya aquatica TaxID=1401087 RepID=A0A375AGN5_9GAMM|nr:MFS transporter [Dickeya aquatica]SLM65177.1 Fosmidomycin resistance protein [Dickeya aquatica]
MKINKLPLLAQVSSAHWVSHFHMMVLPALMPLIFAQRGISYVEIGVALGVFNVVSAIVQTPIGFAVDRLGPRRTLIAGLVLGSLSFLSLSVLTSYPWMVIAMALAGLANAVYHPADYALLSRGIDENRMGRAFSVHTFSGFLGTAVAPAILLGIAALTHLGVAFALAGLAGLVIVPMLSGDAQADAAPARHNANAASALPVRLFTLPIFALLVLFMLLNLSTSSIQNFSVTALVNGYAMPLSHANIALTAFLFTSAFGVLAGGHLADKTRHHGLVATGSLVITAVLVAIVALYPLPFLATTLLLGVAGFLSGIIAPSRDMLVRAASPAGAEGRVFGIVTTGFNIGGAGGPVVFGWLLDNGHPSAIFWSAVIFMVITAVMALAQERYGAKTQAGQPQ